MLSEPPKTLFASTIELVRALHDLAAVSQPPGWTRLLVVVPVTVGVAWFWSYDTIGNMGTLAGAAKRAVCLVESWREAPVSTFCAPSPSPPPAPRPERLGDGWRLLHESLARLAKEKADI